MSNLVFIDEYGLTGSNFYFWNYANKGLSKEDINSVGLTDERVQVDMIIIEPLLAVNAMFKSDGYELYIKEGYRSKALYEIVYQRRCEKFGKADTDKLLNMKDQPHANGLTVDVCLRDLNTKAEIQMRDGKDGTDALFVDFYKDKPGTEAERCQVLQEYLIKTMQAHGFRLGQKREYFHFDYRPETAANY